MAFESFYNFFQEAAKQCQTVQIIADTHFNDPEVKKAVPKRPDDLTLLKMINNKIGKKDFLIHLGDCGDLEYISKLKGKVKWLIMGNHDGTASKYKRQIHTKYFNTKEFSRSEALSEMSRLFPKYRYSIKQIYAICQFYWKVTADNGLFDEVFTGPLIISEKLILSHEPVTASWAFNIHGHDHDLSCKNNKLHFNTCLDVTNYTPINFNQWMKQGYLSKIETIHRSTINFATAKKNKYKNKKLKGEF